jgi:hypothetical protein
MRADKIGDEFNIKYIIKGSGDEYQRIDDLKATGDALIIPLNFPRLMISVIHMMRNWFHFL